MTKGVSVALHCSCCIRYSWIEFDRDAKIISEKLKGKERDGIFGLPRGGLPLAVTLSHLLSIPLLTKPKSIKTLIVDDIADSGKSLLPYYAYGYLITTLFYHKESVCMPDIWCNEKADSYIIFPWEKQECARKNTT